MIKKVFPDFEKLSVIMAVITFAFSFTKTITFLQNELQIDVFGIAISFEFSYNTLIAFLTALLTAAGGNWIIMNHPRFISSGDKWYKALPNLIIPVMSAFIISITLSNMNKGNDWWIVLGFGVIVLSMVLVSEYNVFNPSGENHPLASIILIALTFALFVIFTITLRTSNVRLIFMIPLLSTAGSIAAARFFHLRTSGKWFFEWVVIIALVIAQSEIGLHYLEISPIPYALVMFGLLFGLTNLFLGLIKKKKGSELLTEPIFVVLLLSILIAYFW